MTIGEKLAELRRKAGYKQTEVAQRLTAMGCKTSSKSIHAWEYGYNKLNAEQFLLLCEIYHVTDVMGTFSDNPFFDVFTSLNHKGKERAMEYISLLKKSPEFAAQEQTHVSLRTLPLYDMPVSAGTGTFLDSDSYDIIDVPDNVPIDATFAVRISGDSMMPRYHDKQTVFVRQQQTLNEGEIGIFMLNGDAYCKILGANTLISLNPSYKPIVLSEDDEFRIYGKVVG